MFFHIFHGTSNFNELKKNHVNKASIQKGYFIDLNNKKITFIFDSSFYKISVVKSAFVTGTFTGWSKNRNDEWMLKKISPRLWILTVELEKVNVPGNSGFPEFKFQVSHKSKKVYIINGNKFISRGLEFVEPDSPCKIKGMTISGNNIILLNPKDAETAASYSLLASRIKKLSDFDLDKAEDRAMISNVRLVPGTRCLYRGYHPYKISRPDHDTESTRIALVKQSFIDNGINSVITLSGDEKPLSGFETISHPHQEIMDKGNQLFVNTDYEIVYFHSDGESFRNLAGTIISFIADHPGPYYIHCRLGTDRTGTCSALLASLCGASFEDICNDYQKSNDMGIKEFRDWRLLKYSFEQMLGKKIEEVENLQSSVSEYLLSTGTVSRETLDRAVSNLILLQ